jgi:3,4-dihydroxy 2-butanone 4-phosphate synthase/GTP cyclohydrolase II
MVTHARGVVCLALTEERCDRLAAASADGSQHRAAGTAFTVTVDAHKRFGVTTGVSARDRAEDDRSRHRRRRAAAGPASPGHINPLRARDGGVLVARGQDRRQRRPRAPGRPQTRGVICEIMRDDGEMARAPSWRLSARITTSRCARSPT